MQVRSLFLLLVLLAVAATPLPHAAPPQGFYGGISPNVLAHFKDVIPRVPRLTGVQQPLSSSAPTGLASYGEPTPITASSVMGSITVSEEGIGPDIYPNFTLFNLGLATLQENAVLWIPGYGEYWTQNVIFIYAPNSTFAQLEAIDNMWNFSSPTVDPMNPADIKGNGTAVPFNPQLGFYYYIDPTVYNITTLPYTINLTMSLAQSATGAATVLFSYTIKNGSNTYTKTYDKVTLYPQAKPQPSYYKIGSNTPIGLPSDLEYVLGGPGGGTYAYYINITATEGLYYAPTGSNGGYIPVPQAYSAGSDTAEEVFDVSVTRNLQNPSSPLATLKANAPYTYESTYQLWPAPTTLTLATQPNYQQGLLTLQGQLVYPTTSNGAPTLPAQNAVVTLEVNGQTLTTTTTNTQGEYVLTWTPKAPGIYNLVVAYQGTTALAPAAQTTSIGVTALSVDAPPDQTLELTLNTTPLYVQGATTIFIPLLQGQSLTVTAPTHYYPQPNTGVRLVFQGFNTPNNMSVVLTPNTPTSITAHFQKQ
ncbi:MAG: thermopsin family protease, partial [Thermoprotei archaeon]